MECGSANEGVEPTVGASSIGSESCSNQRSFENDLFSSDSEKCFNAVM